MKHVNPTAAWNQKDVEFGDRFDPKAQGMDAKSRRRSLGLGVRRSLACASDALGLAALMILLLPLVGCGPGYQQLRREGQQAMGAGAHGPARVFFRQADQIRPRRPDNLHDLGACSVMLARRNFEQGNRAAAMRELDAATGYYSVALDVYPGHQASLEGKHVALKLKGQFEKALAHAEWAAEFVGPAARQYLFLAHELEERGDQDGAFLRYRQAVAVEPRNAEAHVAFAKFLIKSDNETAAVRHLQSAYRLNPLDEWVANELTQRGAIPPLAVRASEKP